MSVNVLTRVLRAEGSSDLSEDGGDVQVLRAVGASGAHRRMGSLLPRFLASGGHENRIRLLELLGAHVKREYPALKDLECRAVATGALYLYLVPRCKPCSGRGYEVRPDTPRLSDVPCRTCKGSGRNELPDAGKIKGPLTWAQNELARSEQQFSGAVGRKLGRD
jgi:hypothetical protein